jgi:hypothetical protein
MTSSVGGSKMDWTYLSLRIFPRSNTSQIRMLSLPSLYLIELTLN